MSPRPMEEPLEEAATAAATAPVEEAELREEGVLTPTPRPRPDHPRQASTRCTSMRKGRETEGRDRGALARPRQPRSRIFSLCYIAKHG